MPKKYEAAYFSGALPAVGLYDETGKLVMYVHKQSELDKWTKSKDEGGPGLTTEYKYQEWPKLVSAPGKRDMLAKDAADMRKLAEQGYSQNHWENKMNAAVPDMAAAPSFDPRSDSKIKALEAQIALLAQQIVPPKKKPGRKPKVTVVIPSEE